ncbi:MAG: DUF2059 domain-containing protein [Sphingobacteriales bacterium]
MKLKPFLIAFCCLLFFTNLCAAQTDSVNLTPAHLAAAEQIINTTGMSGSRLLLMRNQMVKSISDAAHIPEKNQAKFINEMSAFMNKYMPVDVLKKNMIVLYAQTFTEDELKQLNDFYKTPLGQKIISKIPELTQKAMQMSQGALKDHFDEIQTIVANAMQE